MRRLASFQGPASGRARDPLITIIKKLGLMTNLQLCLDAGDSNSYSGSGQTWTDVSGQAFHFDRGQTTGAEATDPTFNGTAGRCSSGEYWSFDGADYFESQTVPTWISLVQRDNAVYSALMWVYINTSANPFQYMIARSNTPTDSNWLFCFNADNTFGFAVYNQAGATVLQIVSEVTVSEDAWHTVGVVYNEPSGNHLLLLDKGQDAETGSAVSPNNDNSGLPLYLGAYGTSSNSPLESGARMGGCVMWDIALSAEKARALQIFTNARFSI